MQKEFLTLEFYKILEQLQEYCNTEKAKAKVEKLTPYLSEDELLARLDETTQARKILDHVGMPPVVSMKQISEYIIRVTQGGMLFASELEYIRTTLSGIKALKDFLNKSKSEQVGLAYYSDELEELEEIKEELYSKIKDGKVDDYASNILKNLRHDILTLEEKIKQKAEEYLKKYKIYLSDQFLSNRNGHICIPIKKSYKSKIEGSVIDKSQTGETLYIEPKLISKLNDELQLMKLEEENEVIKILYTLSGMIAEVAEIFYKNERLIADIDFIFAKGKLSSDLKAICPKINTNRIICLKKARHPLLDSQKCIPLDFTIGEQIQGVIITGPNTGGKTVCIKTVGLLSLMAGCGLHVPCEEANICMNSNILCDIGDGQNMTQNLSTFSSHITNILEILNRVNEESLVILDELGSGTDPTEGMGIAIAILEELKKSHCLFIVTTHYPEVKIYAQNQNQMINARMAFDRETLKPLYQLEIGKAGESCALYIASKLGMPNHMIKTAHIEAYRNREKKEIVIPDISKLKSNEEKERRKSEPKIKKKKEIKQEIDVTKIFQIGDSVTVYPNKIIGIVCQNANKKGEVLVQIKKEKIWVNYKRLKLKVSAKDLYPEDYDFSIIFDSVEDRKKRHQMSKKHIPNLEIKKEE